MTNDSKSTPKEGRPHAGSPREDGLHLPESVDALIPWIHQGDLQDDERAMINEQLANSPVFKASLAQERVLTSALSSIANEEASENAKDTDEAWTKFKTRLAKASASDRVAPVAEDAAPQPHPLPENTQRYRSANAGRTSVWRRFRLPQTNVGWLATAQTAALAALAFLFIPAQLETETDEYRLLSSNDPVALAQVGNAVLMLDPSSDQATVRTLLNEAGARIVDGPMENGGYVLMIEPDQLEAGIATLQASETVILAQPLSGEGDR